MNGSRRVRAPSVLPRSGPSCIFKGHLSTKSNAFCTDSSSLRLSTLHMVKNHMAVHYNKILSAKAVVDCSVPLSMSASIKYLFSPSDADQQRREKLKKELAQCERELKFTKTTGQTNSKNNSKALFNTLQKLVEEAQNEEDALIIKVNGYSSFTKSPVTSSERLQPGAPKSNEALTNGAEKSSGPPRASADHLSSAPRRTCSAASAGRGPGSTFPSASRFQLGFSKAPSGDLLDKHSSLFSNRHLPFTPRTLKTEAKSFLSQYRYYTPAKRKKAFTDQRADAETQTEFSSFKPKFETVETKGFTDSEVDIKQAPNCMTYGTKENVVLSPLQGSGLPGDEMEGGALQRPPTRAVCQCSLQHPSRRKIYSDEEELSYLSFIEDVTDEILNLGLFSNRSTIQFAIRNYGENQKQAFWLQLLLIKSLERLFERHVRQNKHRLEEGKMRHLLRILKVNLGCTSEENSGRLDDTDTLDLLDLEKAAHSEHNEQDASIQQERREYRQALDMLLSSPKDENEVFSSHEFFLPVYKSKYSEGVIIQQVGDETNLGPSIWDEKNPSISDGLTDQETSVTVIEGDSDTEKAEPSSELCCLSTALAPSDQLCSVSGDSDDDAGEPALKIMELGIEDGPLDV